MSDIEGFPTADEVKKVRIGSQKDEYLCCIEGNELRHALRCDEAVEETDLQKYVMALNVGKVEDIIVGGQKNFSIKSLTKIEKTVYTSLISKMRETKIYAGHYWENEVFTKLLTGKYSFIR